MDREPLYSSASIVAFAGVLLSALVSFGLDITNDQQSKLLALIGFAASFAVAFLARPKVTPVADPKDAEGNALVSDAGEVSALFVVCVLNTCLLLALFCKVFDVFSG